MRDIQKTAARETKDLRASHRIYTRQTFASMDIERFQSCDQHLYKFMGTEEIVYIRKELNSHRICVEHQKKTNKMGLDRTLEGSIGSHRSITVLISPRRFCFNWLIFVALSGCANLSHNYTDLNFLGVTLLFSITCFSEKIKLTNHQTDLKQPSFGTTKPCEVKIN